MINDLSPTIERLRDAACLAHAIPGVALRLHDSARGRDVLVSASCLAAPLDPCRFRQLVIAGFRGRTATLESFRSIDVVAGLVHLGGGLYQPSHHGAAEDRWFVTSLDDANLTALLSDCPVPTGSDDAFSALVRPDPALGRSAVRVRQERHSAVGSLDEVSFGALSACLVGEVVAALHGDAGSPSHADRP